MTAKHRNKNNASANNEKNASPPQQQDDVAKKSPKPNKTETPLPSPQPKSSSSSGTCMRLLAALCYIALVAGAGFASFYLQQVLEEVGKISQRNEETLRKNTELAQKVEKALQQVDSLQSSVVSLEGSVGEGQASVRLLGAAVTKGEQETQRVEEALQKLQREILLDLSEGLREVKEARERDFSSLERTVEERLAELSRSIADSVAEFAGAQGEARAQLQELRTRLEEREGEGDAAALVKQELAAMATAIADLHTANQVAEGNTGVLREQIGSVREEFQGRYKEMASLSEEIESVRALVRSTAGALREEVSAAEASMKEVADQAQALQGGQEQAGEALRSLEKDFQEEAAKGHKLADELGSRLGSVEDSTRALAEANKEQDTRLEGLLSKYDSQDSTLAAQSKAVGETLQALKADLDGLKMSLGDLQSSLASAASAQADVSALGQQLEAVELRVDTMGDAETLGKAVADLKELRGSVENLWTKAKQLDTQATDINELKKSLQVVKATTASKAATKPKTQ